MLNLIRLSSPGRRGTSPRALTRVGCPEGKQSAATTPKLPRTPVLDASLPSGTVAGRTIASANESLVRDAARRAAWCAVLARVACYLASVDNHRGVWRWA